jgi:hypothetical protein
MQETHQAQTQQAAETDNPAQKYRYNESMISARLSCAWIQKILPQFAEGFSVMNQSVLFTSPDFDTN